jgi:protein-S-isoprenylcysteine O-methyltransferase Ste14
MGHRDLLIYAVHAGFWASFGVAHVMTSRRSSPSPSRTARDTPATNERETVAPLAKRLVALHAVAFGIMYMGLGSAAIGNRVPEWFTGQRLVGTAIIAIGAAIASWARVWFHSWRFQAKLDAGHQLATGGPFRFMRHPIYMGLNLLALGTAVWIPTVSCWIGFVLMVIGSDLRGRTEEKVLSEAFGARYSNYCAVTRRFIPMIY